MFITNSTALKRIVVAIAVVSTLYVLKKEGTLSHWLESKFLVFMKHDLGLIFYMGLI